MGIHDPDITGYNSPVPNFYGSSGQPPFRFDSGAASETNNEYIDFPGSPSSPPFLSADTECPLIPDVPASVLPWNSCLLGSEYSEDQNADYNLFVSLMDPSIASFQGPESLVWGSTDDRYSTPKLLSEAATYSLGPSRHIQVVESESDQRPSRYKLNDQITEFESKISFVPNLIRSQTPIDLTRWSWIYEVFVNPSREELQYVDDKSTSEIDGIRSMQTFSIESRCPQRLMGGSVRYNRMKGPDRATDWWISGPKWSERQNHEAVRYAMELTDAMVAHARTCLMPELLWDSDVPDQSNYLSRKISSVAWQALSCHFPIGFNIDMLFMNRTYISHDPVSLVSEVHRNEVYSAQPLMFMKSSTSPVRARVAAHVPQAFSCNFGAILAIDAALHPLEPIRREPGQETFQSIAPNCKQIIQYAVLLTEKEKVFSVWKEHTNELRKLISLSNHAAHRVARIIDFLHLRDDLERTLFTDQNTSHGSTAKDILEYERVLNPDGKYARNPSYRNPILHDYLANFLHAAYEVFRLHKLFEVAFSIEQLLALNFRDELNLRNLIRGSYLEIQTTACAADWEKLEDCLC
ncbi:hypothetical protein B0H10DRAFT_1968535 [Mycena sp. CBHHK59/15]|nr:hypothetical protein B0H10DRAFT_1968535 [Mycena sp. CBHHK59/15]